MIPKGGKYQDRIQSPTFSGVAYYFGQHLQSKTNIPIGLIHNSVGGSPMEAWIPGEGGRNRNWLETAGLPKWVKGRASLNLTKWAEKRSSPTPHHPFEPGLLFQAGVSPFANLPIKAIVWYQGESNATEDGAGSPAIDPAKNFKTHAKLIQSCAKHLAAKICLSILCNYRVSNRDWPAFREAQSKIDLLIPNTHMAVTIDLGHPTNVHPDQKKPVGERLANLALKYEYGRDVMAESPRLTGWTSNDDSLILTFDRKVKAKPGATILVAGHDRIFSEVSIQTQQGTVDHSIGYSHRLHPIESEKRSSRFVTPGRTTRKQCWFAP